MSNAINVQFLSIIDAPTRKEVLLAVANRYGITKAEALEEISHDEAEHLLDYLTGAVRTSISILMRKHGLVAR